MKPIIYFDDDPSLGLATVTTSSGKTEYRKNCKKVKGEYHAINRDIFEVAGVWYRVKSGLILQDHETGEWFLEKHHHGKKRGVVGFTENGVVMGYFTPNPYNNCYVEVNGGGGIMVAINPDILVQNGYVEDVSRGIMVNPKFGYDVRKLAIPKNYMDNTAKGYNIEDNVGEFAAKKHAYARYTPQLSKDVRRYGRMLGDTTFGFELECAKGYLPEHLQSRYGVVICRDGSLNDGNGMPGPEYVTVPLQGSKGLQTICDLAVDLAKRNTMDLKCSLHVHIGNIPTTRIFLLSLYRLAYKIQEEMFRMFPYYKTDPVGVKPNHPNGQDNYCQKLPQLGVYSLPKDASHEFFQEYVRENYSTLFSWLIGGGYPNPEYNRKNKRHPIPQKWNRKARYYWLNFMNAVFSERNTVEFRLHTPTLNPQKITNWLFICNAIVRYAEANPKKIFSKDAITLDDILGYYKKFGKKGEFLSEYLKAYVKSRKDRFVADYRDGDRASMHELTNDADYVFRYGNVTHLF